MTTLADLQTGSSMEKVELAPVSRMDLIKYSGASGDFNPIHTVDEGAKKAGLPGIIAHGMWTMGNLAKLFTPHLEEGFVQDYQIRFRGMVFLDDVITLKADLTEKNDHVLTFNVSAENQKGKDVIKGTVNFKLYA